jgi:D-cysteine desulfhydrase
LNYPPFAKLAVRPTRIEKLPGLSRELGSAELFVKRDDLTGCLDSGNKIRKLEFLIADALGKEKDTLITCGGVQSNHARATASVAARHGLASVLFLKGEPRDPPDGNLWLDALLGARIEFVSEDEYTGIDRVMAEEAEKLESRGRKPYIIPEGASNWLGAMGYVKAAEEIRDQLDAAGLVVDRIVFACGSGGTHAGLLVGKKVFGLRAELTSINVCQTPQYFVDKIHSICLEADRHLGLGLEWEKDEIDVVGGYEGEGYAKLDDEVARLIRRVAGAEGLILDPVYTGKAMHGLLDLLAKGKYRKGCRILFVHTGGIFSLFAYRKKMLPV